MLGADSGAPRRLGGANPLEDGSVIRPVRARGGRSQTEGRMTGIALNTELSVHQGGEVSMSTNHASDNDREAMGVCGEHGNQFINAADSEHGNQFINAADSEHGNQFINAAGQ